MRLVEFLIQLLEAHAGTLQSLAALLGEEVLIQILEESGDRQDREATQGASSRRFDLAWFEPPEQQESRVSPYAELQVAVRDLRLSPRLGFHLWAYPHYRSFIESELHLNSRIPASRHDVGLALVNDAVEQADAWATRLRMPPELAPHVAREAHAPWLRFRTRVLLRIGKRPMGPVG